MSACTRCGGFVVTEYGETRCMNCGWYRNDLYPETIREPYSRMRCRNCQRPPVKGKTYCQSCLAYMVDYRRKKKAVR